MSVLVSAKPCMQNVLYQLKEYGTAVPVLRAASADCDLRECRCILALRRWENVGGGYQRPDVKLQHEQEKHDAFRVGLVYRTALESANLST